MLIEAPNMVMPNRRYQVRRRIEISTQSAVSLSDLRNKFAISIKKSFIFIYDTERRLSAARLFASAELALLAAASTMRSQ